MLTKMILLRAMDGVREAYVLDTIRALDLLHDEGGVPFRSLLHLRVVPGEVFSGIAGVPAQGFLGEMGCEFVGVRALLGVR